MKYLFTAIATTLLISCIKPTEPMPPADGAAKADCLGCPEEPNMCHIDTCLNAIATMTGCDEVCKLRKSCIAEWRFPVNDSLYMAAANAHADSMGFGPCECLDQ